MTSSSASFVDALSAEEVCPLCLDRYASADECMCVICRAPSCPGCAEIVDADGAVRCFACRPPAVTAAPQPAGKLALPRPVNVPQAARVIYGLPAPAFPLPRVSQAAPRTALRLVPPPLPGRKQARSTQGEPTHEILWQREPEVYAPAPLAQAGRTEHYAAEVLRHLNRLNQAWNSRKSWAVRLLSHPRVRIPAQATQLFLAAFALTKRVPQAAQKVWAQRATVTAPLARVRPQLVQLSQRVRPQLVRLTAQVRPRIAQLSASVGPRLVRLSGQLKPQLVQLRARLQPQITRFALRARQPLAQLATGRIVALPAELKTRWAAIQRVSMHRYRRSMIVFYGRGVRSIKRRAAALGLFARNTVAR